MFLCFTTASALFAQSTTWTGGGATNNWSESANWDSGVPQNDWIVIFSSGGGSSWMNVNGLNLAALNMSGYSGTLILQDWLSVYGPTTLANTQIQNWSLSTGDLTMQGFLNTGTGSVSVSNDLFVYGPLTGSGYISVLGNIYSSLSGSIIGTMTIMTVGGVGGDIDLSQLAQVDMRGGKIDMAFGGSLAAKGNAVFGTVDVFLPSAISTVGGAPEIADSLRVGGALDVSQADLDITGRLIVINFAEFNNSTGTGKIYSFGDDVVVDSGTLEISAGGCELNFGASTTIDVRGTGTFEIAGGAGADRITLQQDGVVGGAQWTLDYDSLSTVNISYAKIQDGLATPTLTVLACSDLGNNTGFLFPTAIDVSPSALDFGPVPVSATAVETLTVYNHGGATLNVIDVSAVSAQFVPSVTSFSVAPGDSQWIEVDFTPDSMGVVVDTLTIVSDDPTDSTLTVPMQGIGAAADLEVTTFSSNTEITRGYDPVTASVRISNVGDHLSGAFRVTLRVSADTVITTDDVLVDSVRVSNIDTGSDTTVTIVATLPKTAPRGDVYLGVIADDLDQVAEYDENNNTAFNALSYQVPVIHAARDIPADQGGQIYLSWYASALDLPAAGGQITEYSVWRAISATAAQTLMVNDAVVWPVGPNEQRAGTFIRIERIAGQTFFWHPIDTTGAYHLETYGYPEPTLFDSTGAGWEYHYYQVIAHTSDELVFYISAPDSAYSVDNIAPAMPQNLAGNQTEPEGLQLTWDANTEPDMSHYRVYRGTNAGFTPGPGNLVDEPVAPGLFDGEWLWDSGFYYKIMAVDVHNNASPYATLGPDLVIGAGETGPPKVNFLNQNRPNPFGADTRIEFGLAQDADVSIRIYDVAGRLVRTLFDGRRAADRYSVSWDGRDNAGQLVSGGVYFYRIAAGPFVRTKKMTLLR